MSIFNEWLEFFKTWAISEPVDKLKDWAYAETMGQLVHLLSKTCEVVGQGGELIGGLLIVVGLFMIRFRNTSVLRWGFIIYFIGFILELIGITL